MPATLLHELIELLLVLRHPQAAQEILKLALLLFEAAQSFGPVIVESLVTRTRGGPPPGPGAAHFFHAAVPTAHTASLQRAHSSTPDQKGQNRKPYRPPVDEAEDRQCNPGWFSQVVEFCNQRHGGLVCEC